MGDSRFRPAPWLTDYERDWWRPDIIASLTLWAILVPQAMAYALLAGVPAVYGLYTAMAAMVGYALLGSSRELNQGPESAVAILTASIVGPLAAGDGERYLALAALLAALVGLWCIIGGLLRLGFITRFLSRPILLGYILGSAVLIVTSQLEALFGLEIDAGANYLSDLGAAVQNLGETHMPTLLLGVALIGLIYTLKRFAPAVPAYLVAAVVGILAVVVLGLDERGVSIVGEIEQGLPMPRIPAIELTDVWSLLGPALAVAVLAFADSVVTAESIAKAKGYSVDADREFFGLGGASLLSALFQGFPVNGSQTRSVVLSDAGARSQMSGVLSAGLVALTLLFLTGLFSWLPDVALAAIVIVAGIGLFDIGELRRIRRIDKADAILALVTAAGVLVLGMLAGIVVAIVLSLLDVARRAITPHTAVLARAPGTRRYRDIDEVEDPEEVDGLLVFRFDAPLFFANVDTFTTEVDDLIGAAESPIEAVVIDAEAITDVDSTAAVELLDFSEGLIETGITIAFARTHAETRAAFDEVGLTALVGEAGFHLEVDEAVDHFLGGRSDPVEAPPVSIRRATIEDAAAIAEVHIRAWQAGYRDQLPDSFLDGLDTSLERRVEGWSRDTVDPDLDVFVAESSGRIVGFSSSSRGRDTDLEGHGELQAIYVLGSLWGKGVGSGLLEASVAALAERGHTSALLWVLEGNERTLAFYERHGWARDGTEKTESWGDLELNEVRMVRRL